VPFVHGFLISRTSKKVGGEMLAGLRKHQRFSSIIPDISNLKAASTLFYLVEV
jgi:hypothetical protein